MDYKYDYNETDNDWSFRWACKKGNLMLIKVMIEQHGVDPHGCNEWGLKIACRNGQLEIINYLISIGCNIRIDNDFCLKNAIAGGQLEVVKFLIENGCNPRAEGIQDYLLEAKNAGHFDVLEYMEQYRK